MKKIFNKLVRDKIPEIISREDRTCKTRVLCDEEFLVELNKKLSEEFAEYLESGDAEELADIMEVISAILDVKKVSREKVEEIRRAKADKNGAFKKRLFLIEADSKN